MIDVGKYEGVNRIGKQNKDGHINSRITRTEYSRSEHRDTNNYQGYCYAFFLFLFQPDLHFWTKQEY